MEEIKKAHESFFDDLMKIQTKLETIAKNSQGFNYKYADLPKVWNSIKKTVSDNGFVVNHEISANGVRTVALHSSNNKLESFIPWSGQVKPQDRGSEITYYKRYNIMAIFNIVVEGEDDDAKSVNDKVKPFNYGRPTPPQKELTKQEEDFINSLPY